MKLSFLKPVAGFLGHTRSFFVPRKSGFTVDHNIFASKKVVALIPTYKPNINTYKLVEKILKYHDNVWVVVVDDSTPIGPSTRNSVNTLKKLDALSKINNHLILIRTPENQLKAGALNFGLRYIRHLSVKPHVVVTFDDDVMISSKTLPNMVKALFKRPDIGAVCSLSRVKNKNINLLTRLQSMEYHSFNMTKIADDSFLRGPLVMQGMLSAFRHEAISGVNGFTPLHLIEDYDITARVKQQGWSASIAHDAEAWTYVPEKLADLWRQRIRWTYGGILVVTSFWKSLYTIFQDFIGHLLFLTLFTLIVFSFLLQTEKSLSPQVINFVLFLALLHFIISFVYNLYSLTIYKNRDKWDWIIKLSILAEFIYSNMLSVILIGSYLFFLFNLVTIRLETTFKRLGIIRNAGLKVFQKFGFSVAWGTRK